MHGCKGGRSQARHLRDDHLLLQGVGVAEGDVSGGASAAQVPAAGLDDGGTLVDMEGARVLGGPACPGTLGVPGVLWVLGMLEMPWAAWEAKDARDARVTDRYYGCYGYPGIPGFLVALGNAQGN